MSADAPAHYTHGHHASVLRSHEVRTAENSAAYLLPHLRPGMALLDVGCGPGSITADLAERVAPGAVTALDSAEAVLETARRTLADRGVDNAVVVAGDVHALPFADDTFDVVHAHQVVQHVGNPVDALREMRRVCRPGGVVAVRDGDYGAFVWYPEVPELDEWRELYQRVARANGGDPWAGRKLYSWALEAGFREVVPSGSVWCHATEESRAWWSGLWAERIVASGIARDALERGEATEADLHRMSEGWHRWGAAADGWFLVPHGEVICRV